MMRNTGRVSSFPLYISICTVCYAWSNQYWYLVPGPRSSYSAREFEILVIVASIAHNNYQVLGLLPSHPLSNRAKTRQASPVMYGSVVLPPVNPSKRKINGADYDSRIGGGSRRGVKSASHSKQKPLAMTPFVSLCESVYRQIDEQLKERCAIRTSDFACWEYVRCIEEASATFRAPIGNVFVSGSNDGMQLGSGLFSEMKPKLLTKLQKLEVVQVAAGSGHSLARTRTGEVYSWGCSDHGEIGRVQPHDMDNEAYEGFPDLVTGLVPSREASTHYSLHDSTIIDVAAGGSQSLYLTIDGIVYMNGCYVTDGEKYRDMPPSDKPDNDPPMKDEDITNAPAPQGFRTNPRQVMMPGKVKKVVCGRGINAAILQSCELLTWGWDEAGELGRGIIKEERNNVLKKVNRPNGSGFDRVLDKDLLVNRFLTPKPPIWPISQKMICLSVACGEFHLICAARAYGSYESAAFSTGVNGHGQLGHGNTEHLNTLKRIEQSVGMHIVQVAAGEYHSLFLDITGNCLWTCGRSDSGQLGVTDTAPPSDSFMTTLQRVLFSERLSKIVKVTAAGSSSMALTDDGKVYAWGFAQEGTLGLGFDGESYETECRPRRVETLQGKCLDVTMGSQHSVFLVEPNE